jgi:hypothetical protein
MVDGLTTDLLGKVDKAEEGDKVKIQKELDTTFTECGKIGNNNRYKVIEKIQFVELPRIFPIEINRGSDQDKDKTHINIEENSSLQLQLYDINGNLTGIEVKYELFAILSHESGHWTSFIKEDDVWFQYNDSCAWKITGKIDDQFWYPDMTIPIKKRTDNGKTKGWNVGKNSSTDSTADIMFYRKTGTETKVLPPLELDNAMSDSIANISPSMSTSKVTEEVKPIPTDDGKTMKESVETVANSMSTDVLSTTDDDSAMKESVETVASSMSAEVLSATDDKSTMKGAVETVASSMSVEEPALVPEESQAKTPIKVTVMRTNNSMQITSNGKEYKMSFDLLSQLGVPKSYLTTSH